MRILQVFAILGLVCTSNLVEAHEGSFQDPGPRQRPRFRYWIPDASVSTDVVASDIRSAGAIGAGGVELLGFYNYGGSFGPPAPGIDWTVTGWGLPAWKQLQDVAIETTAEAHMIIDLSLGPNQGAGVPAPYNDTGRVWQLVASNVSLTAGSLYDGALPGWGRGNFVAATLGQVVTNKSIIQASPAGFTGVNLLPGFRVQLALDSLRDLTPQVSAEGSINLTMPLDPAGATYVLFGFYENQPETYNTPPFSKTPVSDYVQNGSWVVDHFSSRGAQTVVDFWSKHLLDANNTALLREVGNYLWEDSQEWSYSNGGVTTLWTPSLLRAFNANRGYEFAKYLPLIVNGNNGVFGPIVSLTTFVTDEEDAGQRYINDFRQTLTELNANYLLSLSSWAQDLGMQFSAQPGYNLELDLLATIPNVAAPETESLGFNDLIDGYRQFAGPALLAGRNVISSELGAVMGDVYAQSIPDLLFHIKRSLVASINAFVIHGLAWSGTYPSCTWPGYTTFAYLFSEMHGPHLPAWEYYGDWMNYTARSQYILQNSVPKYDVAFWLKNVSYHAISTGYAPRDLESLGYTYQYLSPDNLQLPAARVVNGVLAPEAQSFKALIVRANDTLTAPGVAKLAEYAHAGLPIFFSGGLASEQLGHDTAAEQYINSTINEISGLSNVHVVPYDGLASSLTGQNILPRTTVNMNGTVYSHWSQNGTATDFVILLNDAPGQTPDDSTVTGNVTFQSSGNPYTYNSWTGEVVAIEVFQRSPDGKSITIPISLTGNQTTIIGFDKLSATKASRILSSQGIWSIRTTNSGNVEALAMSSQASLSLSNGSIISISSSTSPPITLSSWTLTLESWGPPTGAGLNDSGALSVRTNTTYNLNRLMPWHKIPNANLTAVAGRGFYNATFNWAANSSTGAIMDLGYILHTARVSVNGQQLPSFDVTNAQMDIGPYLRGGVNTIEIMVSTPLANSLIPVQDELSCLVKIPGVGTSILGTTNGLIKDIVLSPYQIHQLAI